MLNPGSELAPQLLLGRVHIHVGYRLAVAAIFATSTGESGDI